jgi:methionine synthase II (cobalamin-independent)
MKPVKTVIGSLPPKGLEINVSIRWAVELQLKNGIEVITDGEQRSDMIGYFNSLPGLAKKGNKIYIKSKVKPFDNIFQFVKFKDLNFVKRYLKEIGRDDVEVKATITGPVTLGFSCAVHGFGDYTGIDDINLYEDFARAINPIILEFLRQGFHVQLDEPSLSQRVMDTKQAVNIVNLALDNVPEWAEKELKISVHICGKLNRQLVKELVNLNVIALSFAFSGLTESRNIDAIEKHYFKEKKLGAGCIKVQVVKRDDVEDVETIVKRLKKIEEKIGYENIAFIHPDCGLRGTKEEFADNILRNMSLAVDSWIYKR